MANRFSVHAHDITFMPDVAIGVDFDLHATVTEDAFGHHGHHVHAFNFLTCDKRRGFKIRVSSTCANSGHKMALSFEYVTVPIFRGAFTQKGHQILTALDDRERVQTHQFACVIGIAVAGPGFTIGNVAHHRAGVAADLFGFCH